MENTNYRLVIQHPAAMLSVAALIGIVIGCLASSSTSH